MDFSKLVFIGMNSKMKFPQPSLPLPTSSKDNLPWLHLVISSVVSDSLSVDVSF